MSKTEIRDVAPLPFTAFENCEGWTIAGPNNEHVAYCDYGSEAENGYSEQATAAFIVRACNAHDVLVSALEKLLPHAEAEQERLYKLTLKYPNRDESGYEDCRHAVSFAYEAVAK